MNPSSTSIIILAAGNSSRVGLPKQLLEFHGKTLLRHAAETALAAQPAEVIAVLGFEFDRMKHELDDLPVRLVNNSGWSEGIASSVRAGIKSLHDSTEAALIMLCDQPFVTSRLLTQLTAGCSEERPIAATGYDQTSGVPACYKRSVFSELLELKGDQGAKHVIRGNPSRVAIISFQDANIDIDTLEDYRRHIESPR